MNAAEIVEEVLSGRLAPVSAADEAQWHKLWHERGLGAMAPVSMALTGGVLADRLAWVFVASYQAVIRKTFPDVGPEGWAAFAATESRDDAETYPPTTLCDGRLDGCKSWIAQSRFVDHLLVTVSGDDGKATSGHLVQIRADQPGVSLSHRSSPAFLSEMSQGYGRFDAVEVAPGHVLPGHLARSFAQGEPAFVMLAGAGFLLSRIDPEHGLSNRLVGLVLALAHICAMETVPAIALARLDTLWQCCLEDFATTDACQGLAGWSGDNRLFRMYRDGIHRRAERALQG
jgi:hypothetical protein